MANLLHGQSESGARAEYCPGCGAPKGYPPGGPCRDHGTEKAEAIVPIERFCDCGAGYGERHLLDCSYRHSDSVRSVAHASDLSELRAYLATSHGTDYGATDDVLTALLERADAYVAAGGEGGRYWLVGGWLREAYEGPRDA